MVSLLLLTKGQGTPAVSKTMPPCKQYGIGRGSGGDREEIGRGSGGDREGIWRRSGGDQEGIGRGSGGDRLCTHETYKVQIGARRICSLTASHVSEIGPFQSSPPITSRGTVICSPGSTRRRGRNKREICAHKMMSLRS